jgi:hypothetical protein
MLLLTKTVGLLLSGLLLYSHPGLAQTPQRHWLVGWWAGDLQAPGLKNPGRVLTVISVGADGSARGYWGLPGQLPGSAEISVKDSQVRVINPVKAIGEFARQGDDQLVGTLTQKDAKTGSHLNFTRLKDADNHPLVGEWWGTWQIRDASYGNGQYHVAIVGVLGGKAAGQWSAGRAEGPLLGTVTDSTLTWNVNGRPVTLSIDGDRMEGEGFASFGMIAIKLFRKK